MEFIPYGLLILIVVLVLLIIAYGLLKYCRKRRSDGDNLSDLESGKSPETTAQENEDRARPPSISRGVNANNRPSVSKEPDGNEIPIILWLQSDRNMQRIVRHEAEHHVMFSEVQGKRHQRNLEKIESCHNGPSNLNWNNACFPLGWSSQPGKIQSPRAPIGTEEIKTVSKQVPEQNRNLNVLSKQKQLRTDSLASGTNSNHQRIKQPEALNVDALCDILDRGLIVEREKKPELRKKNRLIVYEVLNEDFHLPKKTMARHIYNGSEKISEYHAINVSENRGHHFRNNTSTPLNTVFRAPRNFWLCYTNDVHHSNLVVSPNKVETYQCKYNHQTQSWSASYQGHFNPIFSMGGNHFPGYVYRNIAFP